MVKNLALVGLVLLLGLLGFAATKPNTFRIARTVEVQAAPERIFPLLNDFHRWTAWSPFENLDPELKRTYTGPEAGVGAVYAYAGPKAGEGRMEITASTPLTRLVIQTDFVKPFPAHNVTEFTLESAGGVTRVTWAMSGPNSFLSKLMNVFVNPESFLGPTFEQGLSALKTVAEKEAKVDKAD